MPRGRIEFAILFRFEPPRVSREFLAPFGKTTFTPSTLPRAGGAGYTRPRIFYLWFRDTPDDENQGNTVGRPRGIAAPLTDKMEEPRPPDGVSVAC